MRRVRLCALAITACLAGLLPGAIGAEAVFQEEIPPGMPLPAIRGEATGPDYVAVDSDSATVIDDGSGPLWGEIEDGCYDVCQAGLVFGVEATFLAPTGEPNQKVVLTDLVTGQAYSGSPRPSLGAGIRTWVGLQRNGWGFRFQHWHFGNEELYPNPAVPIGGQPAFNEAFFLRIDTIDIELTQGLPCFLGWKMDSSFGGRYAKLERNLTVVGYGTVDNDVDLYGLAMGANDMEGSGITFSLQGRRPIGCDGGWHTFWRYRGSLLWSDSTASALTEANAVTEDPVGSANSRDQAFAHRDNTENVFISEIQLGVQYERCLNCLPAILFFRAAFEYQHWNTGSVSARSNSFAYLQGGPPAFGGRVDARSNAHDGDLDLVGFTFATGLTY